MRFVLCTLLIFLLCTPVVHSAMSASQVVTIEYGSDSVWLNHALILEYPIGSHHLVLVYDRSRETPAFSWEWTPVQNQFDLSLTYSDQSISFTLGTRWRPPRDDLRVYSIFSWGW